MKLIKLVRDRIDTFTEGFHDRLVYETLSKEEHIVELRKKLLEECAEYLLDPSLGELADIYEVVRALAHCDLDVSLGEVERAATKKRAERGGFTEGLGMYCE